jgi:hypothetical protein
MIFYDRDGDEHEYGPEYLTIDFALVMNTGLRLAHDPEAFK